MGLFAGVWGLLGGVAWAAGVLPSPDSAATDVEDADGEAPSDPAPADDTSEETPEETPNEPTEETPDDEAPAAPVPVAVEDDGTEPPSAPLASPFATSVALRVCDDPLAPVSITSGQLVGDAEPELIVSCGAEVNILGRSGAGIMRVGMVRDASSTPARAANVALTDLGGDGLDDLLVGFIGPAESASASRLVLVPSDERGGLREPQVLAPISALAMASAEMDGRPGMDLVALHQADGFGRRPSEAWVIAGGPSPVRTHRQILHAGGRALALINLDGDDHIDVLSADSTGLFLFPGDGAGRLAAGTKFAEEQATHLAVRSREDERFVAWSVGTELLLRLGDAEPIRQDVGAEVRGVAFDEGAGLLVLMAQSWIRYEPESAALGEPLETPLPARLDALAFCVWGDELVFLARSESGIELLRLPLEGGGEVDESVSAGALVDAPLSLRVDVQ
ncbi:MAG: hypothetical protein AB8H86_07930 [Polyangiales bacterium]